MPARKRFRNKKVLLVIILLVLIVCGLIVWRVTSTRSSNSALPSKDDVIRYSTDKPSEEKPDDIFQWQGGAKDPKKIIIPSIAVDTFIQKVGVDQNNEVAVPNNLHMVGWFVDTVRPGEMGLSLIDGHVTGRQNDGVFKNLNRLNKGDEFSVEFGDGSRRTFRVVDKKSAPVKDSVSIMFSQNPSIKNQLNLVTCSGSYDANSRTYNERLTVIPEQI